MIDGLKGIMSRIFYRERKKLIKILRKDLPDREKSEIYWLVKDITNSQTLMLINMARIERFFWIEDYVTYNNSFEYNSDIGTIVKYSGNKPVFRNGRIWVSP